MANRATPKQKKNGRGKGVAFAKWAKIDKAQRNMLIAVCIASVFLGITIVGIIYFTKVIAFNAKVIGEKDTIIANYKSIQDSLGKINTQVAEMTSNEKLEVVARTRSTDCESLVGSDYDSANSIEDVELARTCTALRVIPDALPSSLNQEAALASVNQLLLWSNQNLGIESISGTEVSNVSSVNGEKLTVSSIGAAISLNDSSVRVRNALNTIEDSIRNFDITSANIKWVNSGANTDSATGQRIELAATYRTYYAQNITIEKKTKKVCADDKSEKCTGKKKSRKKK